MMLYISEGCQPANRLYLVDLEKLERTPSGAINWKAYDVATGACVCAYTCVCVPEPR